MIFKRELAEAIVQGRKTVTRRRVSGNPRSPWYRRRCGYRVGQTFTVNPGRGVANIGRARVIAVVREHLGHLTDEQARAEGFASAEEFYSTWKLINKRYDPLVHVWRLEFEPVTA
jgi:hypothetical protein